MEKTNHGEMAAHSHESTPSPTPTEVHHDNHEHGLSFKPAEDIEKGVPDGSKGEPLKGQLGEPDKSGTIIIGWEKDDDENPKNFSFKRRWYITWIVSLYGILSPLTSSMIAPCTGVISKSLGVTKTFEMNMMVSVYLLGYVVGPFFIGPLSEVYGRRPVLMASNALFIAFNIGCSQARTFDEMVAFRFLAGLGGAGPLSIGSGVLGDLWRAEERGKAAALYSIGPLLGPSLGPIAGGFLAEARGADTYGNDTWRWTFYIVIIVGTISATVGFFQLPETYGPLLLERRARRLRAQTGNEKIQSEYDKKETTRQIITRALVRPIIMLTTQPIIQIFTLYQAVLVGTFYILLVTFTRVFTETYHESTGIASLNFLALALGAITGRQIGTQLMDKYYCILKARNGGVANPEMRLVIFFIPAILIPSGMLIYGWAIEYAVHWIVADIGTFIFAMGLMCVGFALNAYTIDVYPLYAASALAVTNSVRSVFGFAFPLFADDMYAKLGYGWGSSLLALIAFLLGGPGALALYRYGPKLRAMSTYAAGGAGSGQ
ncbi:polyamine transporter 1 [Acaromyces ingoldii]|uniref:Polyamine transporter 1 n=1 Tax=Acaromyces ingoldii TaxID=215250 RepID=A0A316YWE4_9BASI|nr:polyamine transporter 1 [Acaromyces ingoldii]PWN92988.1 polyamine transporter 1 [Acaromyces ingoldii]